MGKREIKITIRRLLVTVEIIALFFELSISPGSYYATVYANAMEVENTIESVPEPSQPAQAEEPSQNQEVSSEAPSGEEQAPPSESAGEGAAAEAAGDSTSQAPQDNGTNPASGQEGQTDAAAAGSNGEAGNNDGAAAAATGDAGKTDESETGTTNEAGKADGSAADAAGNAGKTDEATGNVTTGQEGKDPAAADATGDDKNAEGKEGEDKEGKDKDKDAKDKEGEDKDKDKDAEDEEGEDKDKEDKEKEELEKEEKEKKEKEEKEKEEKEKPEPMEGELVAEESSLKLSFDKEAGIPEGSIVAVSEISSGDEYDGLIGTALGTAGLASDQVAGLKVLDISIMSGEEKVEPSGSVYVEISAADLFGEGRLYSDDEVKVVHIDGENAEVLECSVNSGEGDASGNVTKKAETVGFSTNYFSAFAFIQVISGKSASVNNGSYEITANYDNVSGIPAGTEFVVNEIGQDSDSMAGYRDGCAALFEGSDYTLEAIRAFDISFVDRESGDHYQPGKDISLSIRLLDNGFIEGAEPKLIRFNGQAEGVDAGFEDQGVSFGTSALTVYAIAQFSVKRTQTAGDGSTYLVTVNYDSVSGIPENAVLSVTEITENYDSYAETSSGELGEAPENLEVVRAFDISFRNPETGEEYQPTKGVSVSIDIFDEDLEERSEDLDILHIHGDNQEQAEVVDSSVNDGVVEFEAESFSVFVVVRKVIEQTLTASDGKEYLITVSFDSTAGIPQNAQLIVNEIKKGEELYEQYLTEGLETIDVLKEEVYVAKAFDITLKDPETGTEYQPNKDVHVSIQLLSDELKEESRTDVIHFGDETTVMETVVDGQTIQFQTDGFSIYIVINHESGEVVAPRVEFHFIDRYTDAQYTAGIDVTQATTSTPYNFVNTHGEYQTTQILANGESLELINDPANVEIESIEKFFYGWYVVDMNSDTSAINAATGKYEGEINFNWPDSPKQVKFEQAIALTMQDGNGDGMLTVGDTLQWTINGTTGTGTIDRSGTVHVYLAPLYEDFYFINFHNEPRGLAAANSNLMTRKLVVFGSGTTSSVRIGNVICESPDPQHKIFAGWESDLNGDGNFEESEFFQTVQHVLDAEGNITNEEINNTAANNGYYIDVTKNPGSAAGSCMDLYPVFDEARWLYFNRGISGNNASYVGAAYRLTNDNRSTDDTFYYFDNVFFTGDTETHPHISRRPGYDFKGWYLFANMDPVTGEITNLTTPEDVSYEYIDSNGDKQNGVINTAAIELVDENGAIQNVGTWYISTTGALSNTPSAGSSKFFEVDASGNLRFYRALNEMTLTAKWVEKMGTYRVIIWKQKVTDDKYATASNKDYDYEIFYTSNEVDCNLVPDLTAFSGKYVDENGVTRTVTNRNLLNITGTTDSGFIGFHYARNDVGTRKPNSDGTTVYNVRYDRDLRAINFYYNVNSLANSYPAYTYTKTTATSGTQYGLVNDSYMALTYDNTTGKWMAPEYAVQYQVDNTNGTYGLVDGNYVVLQPKYEDVTRYIRTTTLTDGNEYLIVSRNNAGNGYALGHNGGTVVNDAVTVINDAVVGPYIAENDADSTSVWTLTTVSGWGSTSYKFANGGYYIRRNNRALQISTSNSDNEWSWSSNNNRLSMDVSWSFDNDYLRFNNNNWQLSTTASSVYLYTKTTDSVQTGYTYNNNGTPADYTGDRYSKNYAPTGNYYEYTETRYTRSTNTLGNNWRLITWVGLYGQNFAQNGYSWDDVSAYQWREGTSGDSGTVQTFLDAFIQDDNPYNLATRNARGNSIIYHYRQQLDGKYSITARETAYGSGGNFNVTNKFDGFTPKSYNTGNNGFNVNGGNNNTEAGSRINNPSYPLHIYHERDKETFEFDVNYPIDASVTYSGGKSENLLVPGGVYYEESLETYGSSTNEGITHWYYGVVNSKNTADHVLKAPDHYTFEGWYEDKSCTKRFNFSSNMPAANKIVYAKWEAEKFIIRIDPNGGELDHVNHNGYAGFGTGNATIDGQSYSYNFPAVNSVYTKYPLPGAGAYNSTALQTYIRSSYQTTLTLYDPARRFVAMTDRVASEYIAAGGTVYYYVNYQWSSNDGASGIYNDMRSALYLTEAEIDDFYELYKNIVIYSLRENTAALNQGMVLLDKDTWKSVYVSSEKYREVNSNEAWVFLGWFKTPINEDGTLGTEESMPYNVNDPVTSSFKLTAHWRLDGGYSIEYVPKYVMEDGAQINGTMASWRDPDLTNATLTYADGAATEIYKAPTGLTKNGETIVDDSVIFRGWALVSRTGTAPNYVYTPLETDAQGKINTFYFPSDDYVVNAANAGTDNTIYLQAIYQYKDSSDRRPKVTNLTLDANSDAYVNTTNNAALPNWNYPGTQAINTTTNLDYQGRPKQILFGDIQSSAAVHLYKYATELTQGADGTALSDAHQFFTNSNGHFLLGFDNNPAEGDYIATYPADSVIAITRADNKTIYAVWEPMVYVKFVNNTGVTANNVTFGLQSANNETLQVINIRDGMYDRRPLASYNSITLANGESITLAFPRGAEKTITISGTNTLGVGKKLLWNSSIDLVENGNTTSYTTVGSTAGYVDYSHTASGSTHSHRLVSGEVNNTKPFSFNEDMIVNEKPLTVTFTSANNDYALLLDDNYTGGGIQEYDYALEDIQPDENNVPKSQYLPATSTRLGFSFVGWAFSPTATEPDFSAESPATSPWTIPDLNKDDGFFSVVTDIDGVLTRTLYAVWEARTDKIYVYKEVPAPGSQKQAFTFNVSITGTYRYGSGGGTSVSIDESHSFKLVHGEYLRITSTNHNPTSGNNQTAFVQSEVEVFYPVTNTDGTTSDVKDNSRSYTIRWQKTGLTGYSTNKFDSLTIKVTEPATTYYDTSVTISSELHDKEISVGGNTYNIAELPKTVVTNTASWTNTDAGGTLVFENQRQTYDVKVTKTLESNTTAQSIFNYSASYRDSYVNLEGATVTTTHNLDPFTVTSGSFKTLEDLPAGVDLTITEATDTDDNYKTYCKVDNGSETEGKTCSTFTVGDDPKDSVNKIHEVAYRNVLKSYRVVFKLVDQNGNPTVNGMFALSSEYGSLGSDLYASSTGSNPGVFYTSNKFWAGTYKLSQSSASPKYLKLNGQVTLKVTGRDGITCEDENVTITGNATNGYVITVRNWKTVDITLKSGLLDPMVDQRTFIYSGTYKLEGKTYDLNRNLLSTGASPATISLTAYSTNDGSVSSTQLPKVFAIPVGATELTIREDVTQITVAPDTIGTTYDTTVERNTEGRTESSVYTYSVAIADGHDGDVITFYNSKKTVEINVKKIVETDDTTGIFAFTATLLNGNNPIKGYPIYDRNNTPTNPLDDDTTSNDGEYGFNLINGGIIPLTIPVGAKLTIRETGVSGHSDGNDLRLFATTVKTTLTEGGAVYDGDGKTTYDQENRFYTLLTAPSSKLTVTVTNGPSGQEIKFKKRDGFGEIVTGDATNGPKFRLFTDAACATIFKLPDNTSIIGVPDANGVVQLKSDAAAPATPTEKVPYGVYYMKEVAVPDKYDDEELNTYVVLVGQDYLIPNGRKAPAGLWSGLLSDISATDISAQTDKYVEWFGADYAGYAIFMIDSKTNKAVTTPDIASYGILNISKAKRKVILKKTDGSYRMPTGAKFEILRYDLSPVGSILNKSDASAEEVTEFECGSNNVYFIDDLPYGTYYVHETTTPGGYGYHTSSDGTNWFKLTVDKDGATPAFGDPERLSDPPAAPTPPATP